MNLIAYISIIVLTSGPVINNNSRTNTELLQSTFNIISNDLNLDSVEIFIYDSQFNNSNQSTSILGVNQFAIHINNELLTTEAIKVFIHELIHVSQINEKRLKIYRYCTWFEGVVYNNDTPYSERKYEVEAMQLTEILWQKYRKQFKQL
jgi:hypothetical protein